MMKNLESRHYTFYCSQRVKMFYPHNVKANVGYFSDCIIYIYSIVFSIDIHPITR